MVNKYKTIIGVAMIVWLTRSGVGVKIAAIKKESAKTYLNFDHNSFGVIGVKRLVI